MKLMKQLTAAAGAVVLAGSILVAVPVANAAPADAASFSKCFTKTRTSPIQTKMQVCWINWTWYESLFAGKDGWYKKTCDYDGHWRATYCTGWSRY